MEPKVQVSLDVTSIDEALELAHQAMEAGVDWLEAGTPLILAEGLHGVRALRCKFPQARWMSWTAWSARCRFRCRPWAALPSSRLFRYPSVGPLWWFWGRPWSSTPTLSMLPIGISLQCCVR